MHADTLCSKLHGDCLWDGDGGGGGVEVGGGGAEISYNWVLTIKNQKLSPPQSVE